MSCNSPLSQSREVNREPSGKQETYPVGSREPSFIDLVAIVWEGRFRIALSTIVCGLISVAYAMLATPIYESRVVMVPADEKAVGGISALSGQLGGLASLAGIEFGGGASKTATALEIVNSYAFQSDFIEGEDLKKALLYERWDSGDLSWVDGEPTLQDAVKRLRENLTVVTDKTSGTTTLIFRWVDAGLAAEWANELVERLNNTVRSRDIREARSAVAYLKERLPSATDVDLRATLYRLIEAQTRTIMLANVRQEYVFQVVDPAYPSEQRVRPRRSLVVVLGVFCGILLGALGVLIGGIPKLVDRLNSL